MTINKAFKAILEVKNVSGKNDKEAVLKRNADVPLFKDILKFVYDPYIRTGIGAAKYKKVAPFDIGYISFNALVDHFMDCQTGTNEDVAFAKAFVEQFIQEPLFEEVAYGIVTKTLKIGVTAKTLNKVYGEGFIPLIGIMRGLDFEKRRGKVNWPVIMTEKIDGARRLLVKENGKIQMYSRSGIPDDGLVDILAEATHLPDNCVYDGELEAIGEFDNFIEVRQATNSIANKGGERTGLNYKLFDMMPIEDYKLGKSKHDARTRKTLLGALFGDVSIECLAPHTYKEAITLNTIEYDFKLIQPLEVLGIANDEPTVMQFAERIWSRGGEGIMLNTTRGFYDFTREQSPDLLKVKHSEEMIVTVIDMELGKPGTVNENRLGSLIVEYKGHRVGVGMGLSHDQRDLWWIKRDLIIGKQIEVETFGESKNKDGGVSLNCAVFKRVVGEE